MSDKIKLLAVVSDLHCGSEVALAPPSFFLDNGNEVSHGKNIHQQWLWKNWMDAVGAVKKLAGKDPVALLLNGDAVEGVHHRNNAELMAAKIEEHIRMTEECLNPLLKLVSSRFVVKGTECHTRDIESLLADRIGAETSKAKDKWLLKINGCLVDAAHHMGTTSRAYLEASLMSIQMGNARLNYLRAGHEVPKVFLRAHRHCGGHYSDGQGLFAVTGAWQFLTRHGFKVVTDAIPRPSILLLDWRNKPEGALPQVHDITFNPPPHEQTTL